MPAEFPTAIATFRTIENRPGVVYDEDDTKTLYAEDLQKLALEVVALQTALGAALSKVVGKSTNGNALLPLASRARAYRSSTSQSLADNTWTKVQLNAETFDQQNEMDVATNYRFTAKEAGYYQVNGGVHFGDSVANALVECAIYKNGTRYATGSGRTATASGWMSVHARVSDIVYLAVNDYVELYAWTYGGANHINCNTEMTNMSIHKLS